MLFSDACGEFVNQHLKPNPKPSASNNLKGRGTFLDEEIFYIHATRLSQTLSEQLNEYFETNKV